MTPSLATVHVSRDDELLALRFEEDEGEEPEKDLEEEEEPGEDEEEEKAEEEPEEEPEDGSSEEAPSLGLSVSAPDSIARSETACFEVTLWNHDSDATAVTVTFEISDITESSTVEIVAGDSYALQSNTRISLSRTEIIARGQAEQDDSVANVKSSLSETGLTTLCNISLKSGGCVAQGQI